MAAAAGEGTTPHHCDPRVSGSGNALPGDAGHGDDEHASGNGLLHDGEPEPQATPILATLHVRLERPGTQRRNFTHVDDVVAGLLLVGEKGEGDEFGLGAEESYSILDIAEMFGGPIEMLPQRPGNRMNSSLDVRPRSGRRLHPSPSVRGLTWPSARFWTFNTHSPCLLSSLSRCGTGSAPRE